MQAFRGRLPRRAVAGMLAATCLMAVAQSAYAQVAPPFATLLRESEDAPRLAVSEAGVRQAEGLRDQARARPNPSINVMTENVAGSSPYSGFGRAETTLQYSQPIELGGKRSARIAAGEAGVVASRARDRDARVVFAYDLARAYAAAEIGDRRVGLAEDEVEEAQSDLKAAEALVGAGKETRLRALQARSALNEVSAQLDLAKANRISAYVRLSALVGADAPFASLAESLLDTGPSPDMVGPVDPTASPALLVAEAERAAAARRLDVESRRATPDITASVGVRRLEYEGATAVLGGVTIPLHLFDRNRGNIAASRAEVDAAEARLAVLRAEARAEAQSAAAELSAAESRVTAARGALATADETYRLARIAYEAGKSPLVELLAARHGLGTARSTVLDAETARFEARARLARLAGRTITGEPIQ
ncbi:MAG: TolC family protein [Microbacterium sp.]|jgi:cobalt-zinc-cadmium efflux system outer membrane protein|uniref:TolC family protein n=3 Tax=Sphingomonadaceae TaxID=41297 RepID=A0A2A4FUH0_9SPHN|nr:MULTISPECIES: TolC family protein [Sphingomonadaceae]MAP62281.1 TolC family protein [Microbacterium sp.]ATE67875.1 TolC family protein [Rhizorhabdus dicambivorans]MCC4233955.1 TolC family protein [Sphingobium soli]PCE42412.1 TolC family protein [Rhizorhabdus dicambivorans]BBE00351.1 TolC family protein [Sphingobium amiense]